MNKSVNKAEISQIWNMLDKLSISDPVAYRKFIKEQLEAGKQITSPPNPEIMIRLNTKNYKFKHIFIVICSWSRIPMTKLNEPVNILGGKCYLVEDYIDNVKSQTEIFPIGLCDELGSKFTNCQFVKEELDLIDLIIEFVNKTNKISIDNSAVYEIYSEKYFGGINQLYDAFEFSQFDPEKEMKEILSQSDENVDVLSELQAKSDKDLMTDLQLPNNKIAGDTKMILEEIENPVHVIHEKDRIQIQIKVSGIQSIDDLELDMSETRLHLEIRTNKKFQPIEVNFPKPILLESVRPKFRKKNNLLTIVAHLK